MMDSVLKSLGTARKKGSGDPKRPLHSSSLHPEVLGGKRQMIRVRLSELAPTFLGFLLGAPRGAENGQDR